MAESQGPAGEEWDEELDGDSPELSPLGRPLADGLSIACRDSYVLRNVSFSLQKNDLFPPPPPSTWKMND